MKELLLFDDFLLLFFSDREIDLLGIKLYTSVAEKENNWIILILFSQQFSPVLDK